MVDNSWRSARAMQPTMRMRRPRRHKFLTVSIFFITYSIFHAVLSASVEKVPDPPVGQTVGMAVDKSKVDVEKVVDIAKGTTPDIGGVKEKTLDESKEIDKTAKEKTEIDKNTAGSKKLAKEGAAAEVEEDRRKEILKNGDKKKEKDAGYEDDELMVETREKEEEEEKDAIPTVHPLRNCTAPAIEQFPQPLMGQSARRHGGLIIHVLVAVYTFIGLAIVCDEYFVSSLDRICEEFKLAPDVAGATFMAAGSSAPELATVIIGVFCAQDDIGVSGVIGSAVFNIMFVISVCALCAGTVSHLNWWPLCRDCFFYALSILVMLCTIANGYVSWPESLFMLIMYGVYCVALRYNAALEAWACTLPLPFKLPTREEQAALVTYKSTGVPPASGADGQYAQVDGQTKETPLQNPAPYNAAGAYDNAAYNAEAGAAASAAAGWGDPNAAWDPNQMWESGSGAPPVQPTPAPNYGDNWGEQTRSPSSEAAPHSQQTPTAPTAVPVPATQAYYKAKEYNPETAVDPLVKPVGANRLQLCCFYIAYPIHWLCRHSMPDCRGRWYPVTFVISMMWISFYSYFMVWMIVIIGYTLGVPDTVMGLTFVAAGVSVPDALSSLAVIKEGYGDMAVSNAVGSNVFDILVCLGLPWFIQTAIIAPGSHVNVISKGLIYSTLSLFSTVIFLVVATHANGWKLDRKYGAVLMVWYLLFITFASLYELNIFGDFHPPDCVSVY